jgi:hypothetical protein
MIGIAQSNTESKWWRDLIQIYQITEDGLKKLLSSLNTYATKITPKLKKKKQKLTHSILQLGISFSPESLPINGTVSRSAHIAP